MLVFDGDENGNSRLRMTADLFAERDGELFHGDVDCGGGGGGVAGVAEIFCADGVGVGGVAVGAGGDGGCSAGV